MRNKNLLRVLESELGVDVKNIDPRKIIRTDKQFEEKVMGEAIKKSQINCLSFEIAFNQISGCIRCAVSVNGVARSRTVDVENYQEEYVRDGNKITSINKFSWDIISVKLNESAQELCDVVFENAIAVLYNRITGWVNVFVEKHTDDGIYYYNLEDGKDYTELPQDPSVYTLNRYKLVPVTASGSRNRSGIFQNVTLGDRRFEIYNEATVGGLRKQKLRIAAMLAEVTCAKDFFAVKKEVKKAYGYLGNVGTASYNGGKVPGFHVYKGKWNNPTQESFLRDDFVKLMEKLNKATATKGTVETIEAIKEKMNEIVNENKTLDDAATQDGQMYVNVIELAKLLYGSTGYFIYPEVLLGRMIQVRPATVKASAVVVSPFVYKMLIKGSEDLAELNNTEVKPYGDKEHSLFLADMNCIKLDFEMEEDFDFEILAFNKTSEGSASKQIYKNILFAAKKQGQLDRCLELIEELETLTVDMKMSEAIDANRPAKMVTPNDVLNAMKSGFYTNVMTSIAPGFVKESKPLMESAWKQVLNSVVDDIDRMRGNINVESRRLASDPTFIITGGRLGGILTLGKSFINDKRIKESVMFKYPVAGMEEQYASKNTEMASIIKAAKKNVKSGVIEQDHCEAIIQFFGDLKRTVRVLPALMFLAKACAGLDFDYDGECSIIKVDNPKDRCQEISNEFVDILFNNGIRGVAIDI